MKYLLLSFLLLICVTMGWGQAKASIENVLISSKKNKTCVKTSKKGELMVNISLNDLYKFKKRGWVLYSELGASGDGKTDDINNIAATHAVANKYELFVKADDGATYYIGGKERTAVIRTNTDFGKAAFIIDDTEVQNRSASVFMVSSALQPFKLETISSLKKKSAQN